MSPRFFVDCDLAVGRVLALPADVAHHALRVLRLTDVGDGATRHLYCSRAVPSEWLADIDHALAAP